MCGTFRIASSKNGFETIRSSEWGGSNYPRQLLKCLLCCPGRQARRDALIEMLWPESAPEQGIQNLNIATTKLRKVLGHLFHTENDVTLYRLEGQESLWVDVDEALVLLKEAERAGRTSSEVLSLLEMAADAFRHGRLLEDEDGLWVAGRRATIDRNRYRCRLWLADAYIASAMLGQAENVFSLLLEEDPFDEDVLCRLLCVMFTQRMAYKAIKIYEQTEALFVREGMTFSQNTRVLMEHLQEEKHLSRALLPVHTEVEQRSPSVTVLLPTPPAVTDDASLFFTEGDSEDCATWFSEKLVSLIAFITQQRRRIRMTDFERLLDRELRIFDAMQSLFPSDAYLLSRRNALLFIAALPKGLLGVIHQRQKGIFIEEELLPVCAGSIAACWYLMNGREFASVERALARYMPFLIQWAQESSTYQKTAAYLAAQGLLLSGFIALHRLQLQQRVIYCREAVKYAREANEHALLVKALTQLGNAYYDRQRYQEMLHAYQEATTFLQEVPCSLQSKVLMGLAHAHAQQGNETDAMMTLTRAREVFPETIEDVPAFLAADDGEYSLILFEGWIRLDLGKHYPEREYNEQAATALAQIDHFGANILLPERYRHEIVNRRAQAAIALGQLDLFHALTVQSAEMLRMMQSEKRRQELLINYKTALRRWPREASVTELADVVLS